MTEEWGELSPERIGRVTASRVKDVIAEGKRGGYLASRDRYRTQLILERQNGVAQGPSYENAAMKWGKENEPLARIAYELDSGNTVEKAGFIIHPTIPMAGASPDGAVNNDGLVEIKCPESHTHHATLKTRKMDIGYMPQVQWQLACTKRLWCDWVSFDPRFKPRKRIIIDRIMRDNKYIANLEEEVRRFLAEVDAEDKWLEREYPEDEAA